MFKLRKPIRFLLLPLLFLSAVAASPLRAQTTVGGTATLGVSASLPITVSLAPPATTLATSSTQTFILTITNDSTNAGANLSLACSGSCGSLSASFARNGASITYTAPSTANTITLTATSAQDPSRFALIPITVTSTTPPAVVNNVSTPLSQASASTNTYAIPPTIGNSVIVAIGAATADTISGVQACSPSNSCTSLTQACPPVGACFGTTTPGGTSYQYYGVNLPPGLTSIVVSNSVPSGNIDIGILDVSGLGGLDVASIASNQTTSTTTPTGPALTPTSTGELMVANISSTGNVNSVNSPYTFAALNGGDGMGYQVENAVTSYAPSYTSSSGTWSGFHAAYNLGTSPANVRVNVAPTTANVQVNATQAFTATVTNDSAHAGVTWALAGGSCSGATCGTLSSSSSASGTSITYTAPGTVPGASVSRVQHTSGVVGASSGSLSIISSTSGDILCGIAVWNTASGSLTVTDSASQTYTAVISGAGTGDSAAMACKANTASGVTSLSFSVGGASPTVMEFYGLEYAGVATSTPVDQSTSATGSVSPMDSGFTSTTTNTNDVLVGFGYNGASLTFTAGNDGHGDSYTLLDQRSSIGSAVEDFFTTAATNTYKATLVPATTSGSRMFVVALKASAAGSSNVTLTATSVTDGSKTAVATINVGAAAIVGVAVSPTSASTTSGGATVSITPTVSNDPPNGGVTWTLSGVGTLSASSSPSGTPVTYTPPASVSSTQTVTVTATAVDDNTKSASSLITVSQPGGGGGGSGSGSFVCNPSCPAFTGTGGVAQGAGAVATGGRGGKVYLINDLTDNTHGGCVPNNSSTTCSLRDCLQDTANVGARNCVFLISGAITNTSRLAITKPGISIWGQTAPGGPITLHSADKSNCPSNNCGTLWVETSNVIVRYISYDGNAPGLTPGPDSGTVGYEIGNGAAHNVIFDHTSARWWGNKVYVINSNDSGTTHDITVQWSLMYEPNVGHPVILLFDTSCAAPTCNKAGGVNQDYHHNMGINFNHRWPMINVASVRWVNNIGYGWGRERTPGNTSDFAGLAGGPVSVDYIGNKIFPGLSTPVHPYLFQTNACTTASGGDPLDGCPDNFNPGTPSLYMLNNIGPTCSASTTNSCAGPLISATHAVNDGSQTSQVFQGWEGGEENGCPTCAKVVAPATSAFFRSSPQAAETFPITADPAENLDTIIPPTVGNSQHLDPTGCTGNFVSYRDSQDARVIAQYLARGSGGPYLDGSYNGPTTSPAVQPGTACAMSQNDGIPTAWKSKYGLSTSDPNLYKTTDPITGVTFLEDYVNGLIP